MRPRRGLAFRPTLAAAVWVECLEDRRLLSVLGGSSAAEDLPAIVSSQLVGNSADVMSVSRFPGQCEWRIARWAIRV